MRRVTQWLAVVVLGLVLLGVLAMETTTLLGVRATGILGDLTIYRQAMEFQQAGGSIYDYVYIHPRVHGLGFTYPPFAAIVLRPMTWAPEPVVGAVWLALTVITFAALTAWVVRVAVREGSWLGADPPPLRVVAATLGAISLGMLSFPFLHHFVVGQVSLFIIALCLVDVGGLVPPRWRGVLVGVAAAIKLTPLIFVPYFLVRRQYRSAALATGTFVAASALAWLIFPSDSVAYWGTKLFQTSRVGRLDNPINKSLLGTLSRWGVDGGAALALWLLAGAAVAAVVFWRVRRYPGVPPLVAALEVGCLGTLLSPISWPHHQLWAVLAAVWLLLQCDARRVWLGVALVGSFLAYAGFVDEGDGLGVRLLREAAVASVVLVCVVGLSPRRVTPSGAATA